MLLWSASSRESISSSQRTPRSSLTLSTQNTSLEENVSNTYSQIESLLVPDHSPIISSINIEPEIRHENYTGPRGPILPAIHNQNPPTRSRTREYTERFLLDHTSNTPAPVLYGPTSLGHIFSNWARERLEHFLNLTTRQRQNAINVLSTPSLELHFQSTIKYNKFLTIPFTQQPHPLPLAQHHLFALISYTNLIDIHSKHLVLQHFTTHIQD